MRLDLEKLPLGWSRKGVFMLLQKLVVVGLGCPRRESGYEASGHDVEVL
jgi:hypothetical protein